MEKTNQYGKNRMEMIDIKHLAMAATLCLFIFLSGAGIASAVVVDGLIGGVPGQINGSEYDQVYLLVYTQDIGPEEHIATVYTSKDANGDWYFALVYSPEVINDNCYGTNCIGPWKIRSAASNVKADGTLQKPHTFDDLLKSDHSKYIIRDTCGNTVLDFGVDLLASRTSTPKYGSGGHNCSPYNQQCDGFITIGDKSKILKYATSTQWNMWYSGYDKTTTRSPLINETLYNQTKKYQVVEINPATGKPYEWEFLIIYEFKVDGSVFTSKGCNYSYLGDMHVHDVHNSPYKKYSGVDIATEHFKNSNPPSGSNVTYGQPITYTIDYNFIADMVLNATIIDGVDVNGNIIGLDTCLNGSSARDFMVNGVSCGGNNCYYNSADNTVVWRLGNLGLSTGNPVRGEVSFTIDVICGGDETIYNRALVTSTSTGPEVTNRTEHYTIAGIPDVDINKTANETTIQSGENVTYTYVVKNTGSGALTNCVVTDNVLGTICGPFDVAIGGTHTCTTSSPLYADTTNVGTVSCNQASDNDDAFVDVITPSINVVKTANPAIIQAGGTVTYTYVVTNTGDVTLTNITLNDNKIGAITCPATQLAAGANMTCTKTAIINVDTTNVATVTGNAPNGDAVTDNDTAFVDVITPSIDVVKTADPAIIQSGETVTYTYVVTNTGDVTLTNITLNDNKIGAITCPATQLAAGANMTCTKTAIINVDTTNVATVTGNAPNGDAVTDNDTAFVDVITPSIDVVKTADPAIIQSGETVTYTYVVTNTGDVTLTNITLNDNKIGAITCPATQLAAGANMTCTKTAIINVDTTNVVIATGNAPTGDTVSDNDSASVDVINPAIDVEKTANPTTILPGETVTYTYVVTNTGDVELTSIALNDDKLGTITCPSTTLAVGASMTCTATAIINVDTTNVVIATGNAPTGDTVSDNDSASVDVINPAIDVEKTANPTTILPGETVTYTYVVTNTGDVELTSIALNDDKLGTITCPSTTLAVGASMTCTATAIINVDTTNVVIATGNAPTGDTVSDNDSASVDVINPAIDVEKTANPTMIRSGRTVTYTYVVTNTGDVTLTNVVLTDNKLGTITCPATELGVGASMTCTKTAVITVDTTNVATVTGNAPNGDIVKDNDTAFVDVIHPSIIVEKTADPSVILSGDLVTYTYLVTNTGDVPLVNIVVSDDKLGLICTIPTLASGASSACIKTIQIYETTTNVVVITGEAPDNDTVSDNDTTTVDVIHPNFTVIKTADKTEVHINETVTYTYLINNTGDCTLYNITVADNLLGSICNIASLGAGETATCNKSTIITENTTNVAIVTAKPPVGPEINETANETVTIVAPNMTIEKEVIRITYRITYTNNGNADAANVVIADTIPVGSNYISNTCNGTQSGKVVTMNIGTVQAGGSGSCEITIGVEDLVGLLSNLAELNYKDPVTGVSFPSESDTADITL